VGRLLARACLQSNVRSASSLPWPRDHPARMVHSASSEEALHLSAILMSPRILMAQEQLGRQGGDAPSVHGAPGARDRSTDVIRAHCAAGVMRYAVFA